MKKQNDKVSFQDLTDWLNQNSNGNDFSKSGNKIVKKDDISASSKKNGNTPPITTFQGNHMSHGDAQPEIELVKDGDSVSAIKITCVCGQVINIDLDYHQDTQSLVIDK